MKKFVLSLFSLMLLLSCLTLKAQTKTYPFEKWTQQELQAANTADTFSNMSPYEKKVVFYSNLARINGPLFVSTYLQKYLDSAKTEESGAVQSLKRELNELKPLAPLKADLQLNKMAREYASFAGAKGMTGHYNFNQRFKEVDGRFFSAAENCFFGEMNSLHIVMSLLIDEFVPGYGHRKNILSKSYQYVGVGIMPHKNFDIICVMDFGGK